MNHQERRMNGLTASAAGIVSIALLFSACTGQIGGASTELEPGASSTSTDPNNPNDPSNPINSGTPDNPNGSSPPIVTGTAGVGNGQTGDNWKAAPLPSAAGYSPTARLSRFEYEQTISRAFGKTLTLPQLPADENSGMMRNPDEKPLGDYEVYVGAAIDLGKQLANRGIADACGWAKDAKGCVRSHLAVPLATLYRSPVTDSELDGIAGIVAEAATRTGNAADGVTMGIARALLEPRFLYQIESGVGTGSMAGGIPLTPHELSARLSYFLWDAPPDKTLSQAANSGAITAPTTLTQEATRAFSDAQTRDMIWRFVRDWLRIGDQQDVTLPTLTQSMLEETRRFVEYILVDEKAPLSDLIGAHYSFLNKELAKHYGVPEPVKDWERYEFPDSAKRRGILTHGSFLMSNSSGQRDVSWIFRGKVLFENLFCGHLGAPPPGATDTKVDSRVQAPACKGCHTIMDPAGQLFDGFDARGALVAPSVNDGALGFGSDIDGPYTDLFGLTDSLGKSKAFSQCFVKLWFRYALGRDVVARDQSSFDAALGTYEKNGSVRQLLLSIIATPAFASVYPKPSAMVCK
jgi:hypothetical protein